MKQRTSLVAMLLLLCTTWISAQQFNYSVERIWGDGSTYNAFTALVKFKGKFYCAFREGRGHVFDENGNAEGKIRILCSSNGKKWETAALIGEPGMDYRDPKLDVMPNGDLMVSIGVSVYRDKKLVTQIPTVCFTSDGKNYSKPEACIVEDGGRNASNWIWRTTWHKGVGYAINYFTLPNDKSDHVSLMKTLDGKTYQLMKDLDIPDFPNESTIRFLSDDRMALMVRRDRGNERGYWGLSKPPYTDWDFKEMTFRVGGPDFLMLDDTKVLLCSRSNYIRWWDATAIYCGNAETGEFYESMMLPSGGDTSYAGMLIEGDEVWISYYSGHETDWPSIYLAKIPLKYFNYRRLEKK